MNSLFSAPDPSNANRDLLKVNVSAVYLYQISPRFTIQDTAILPAQVTRVCHAVVSVIL